MKNRIIALLVFSPMILTSCMSSYKYCQIFETRPDEGHQVAINKGNLTQFEDENCKVSYYLWSEGGNASFSVYNKTEEVIHIDLAESFFILNGIAYDYFKAREWSQTTSSSYRYATSFSNELFWTSVTTYTNSRGAQLSQGSAQITPFGTIYGNARSAYTETTNKSTHQNSNTHTSYYTTESSSQKTTGVSWKEMQVVSIPPHSSKIFYSYGIISSAFRHCDLDKQPKDSARITFDTTNTPIRFANYLTYTIGDEKKQHTIRNGFYVSAITNYATQIITEYIIRETPCKNILDDDSDSKGVTIYDKYIIDSVCTFSNSFYAEYSVTSRKKLYEKKNYGFVYNSLYNGYTLTPGYTYKK